MREPHIRTEAHNKYRKHRNFIPTLLKRSKHSHFTNFFQENIKETQNTWKRIENIISLKISHQASPNAIIDNNAALTNPVSIANAFNKYFSPIRNSYQRCSIKKVFLKISQNTCARVSFLIKLQTLAQVFFCEFCEIFKNTFFTEHLWTTASVLLHYISKPISYSKKQFLTSSHQQIVIHFLFHLKIIMKFLSSFLSLIITNL